jgi:hypothetical protein
VADATVNELLSPGPRELLEDGVGDQDPTWFRRLLEPGRQVHPGTEHIIVSDHDIAEVDPDAKHQGLTGIGPGGQLLLNEYGRINCADH